MKLYNWMTVDFSNSLVGPCDLHDTRSVTIVGVTRDEMANDSVEQ